MKSLRFMQQVSFDAADITDWMYIEDGRLAGGYTTRLLRERQKRGSSGMPLCRTSSEWHECI